MNQTTLDFFLNQQVQINFISFVQSLIAASILCVMIQFFYIKFSKSLSNKNDFSKNFIGLGLATTIVITVVKSSLALSLGLVGALSIVRFRAAIKEPEELIYLFLVIATGLGCGAGQIKITVVGIITSLILILTINLITKKKLHEDEILNSTFTFDNRKTDKEINDIIKKVEDCCEEVKFISLATSCKDLKIIVDARTTGGLTD